MELNKAKMSLAAETMKKDKLSQILRWMLGLIVKYYDCNFESKYGS